MPVFSERYSNQTVQQLGNVPAARLDPTGRVVRLTNENYTIDGQDEFVILAATTSTGNYTITFPTTQDAEGFPIEDGKEITVMLAAALGGTDAYVTSGITGGALTLDAAGDRIVVRLLRTEAIWRLVVNGIA